MNVLKWLGYILLLGLFIWFVFFRKFNPFATKTTEIVSTTTQEVLDENAVGNDVPNDDEFVDETAENIEEVAPEASTPNETTPKTERSSQNSTINLNQRYQIVVGSFGKKANAEKMQQRVKQSGNDAVITNINGMHRVITGSTDDLSNAKKLRDHFTYIFKETAFILEN